MVKIICDVCGAERPERPLANTEWILGYDLETETPNAVRRSIRLLDHWDDRRVLEFGAIHLCSIPCRDHYMSQSAVHTGARA